MPTYTSNYSLPKPAPNSERDWGYRLNEALDLIDSALGTPSTGDVHGFFYQTATGTLTVIESAPVAGSVTDLVGTTETGTVSGTLAVDGVDVGGIDNVVWNTSQSTKTATSSATFSQGSRITLTVSGVSAYSRFGWTMRTSAAS